VTSEQIRHQLQEVLEKDQNNTDKIFHLSNQLARLDKDKIRFSVDAGVIDRLGRELVARQETAVSELVKNAYDADATEVTLTFKYSDVIGGTLIIEDDGVGMTREQLVNGFMRISSTDKIRNPISEKYGRKRAGQKGIGRFAVQRLGKDLTIITQTKDNENALELSINWEDYKGGVDLFSITNSLEIIPKAKEEGTTLIIKDLRDRWSRAAIRRVYRYVVDIIQPVALRNKEIEVSNSINEGQNTDNDSFKTSFYKYEGEEKKLVADDDKMIYDHALATINGYIDDEGIGVYSIESKKLEIDEISQISNDPDDDAIPFDKLSNVEFRAYYFIYDKDLIPAMQSSSIRKLARKKGGIRLYRNGFRVLPYGEQGDDWLALDASVRKRSILPTHANINFFGFVQLTDNENQFNETSSREGLTENEALIQLKNFVYRTIISGIIKIAEVRNVKLVSGQRKDEKGSWDYESIDVRIKNIAFTLEKLDEELEKEEGSIQAKKRRKKRIKKIKKEIEKLQETHAEEQKKYIKEKSMLRVLSSVGLTIGQFIHEVKHHVNDIRSDIGYLIVNLQDQKTLLERAIILETNFTLFHNYTSFYDKVVSQNVVRELSPLEIREIVRPFISSIENDAKKAGISIEEPIFNGYQRYTKSMHPSEWSSILFNFYTNSKKAIKRAGNQGKILIECGLEENMIYLEFSDNGDGISKENEEEVFNEFFTTTSQSDFNSLDYAEIAGTGLGLKIVKDIVSSYRGKVYVASPKADYTTCIRVEIPSATDKELKEYGL